MSDTVVKCVWHATNNKNPCPKDADYWAREGAWWYAVCVSHSKSMPGTRVSIEKMPDGEKSWCCHHKDCVTNRIRPVFHNDLEHAYNHGFSFGQSVTEEEVQATVRRLQELLS